MTVSSKSIDIGFVNMICKKAICIRNIALEGAKKKKKYPSLTDLIATFGSEKHEGESETSSKIPFFPKIKLKWKSDDQW